MEQAQNEGVQARNGRYGIKRIRRTDEQKAVLAAMAKRLPGGAAEVARVVDIPERTIRLYVKQAEELEGNSFAELSRQKSDELGALGYDLCGGALRRLGSRLNADTLSERGLLSLAGLGHNIGKEAFGHSVQAQNTVNVQVNLGGEEVAQRLSSLADRLAALAVAPGAGAVVEGACAVLPKEDVTQ